MHPPDTDSGSASTIHYGVTAILQPMTIAAISFEVVEWSEQLRSVISVWLGTGAVEFESDFAPAGEK